MVGEPPCLGCPERVFVPLDHAWQGSRVDRALRFGVYGFRVDSLGRWGSVFEIQLSEIRV